MEFQEPFKDLENKKVLITGATGGLGSCMAELFANYGAHVGLHYNSNKVSAEKLLESISKTRGRGVLIQGNLLSQTTRENLVKKFIESQGKLDVLINNAGSMEKYLSFSEISEEDFDRSYGLNLKAPFFLMSSAMQHMKEKVGGRIINISSANVKYGGSEKSFHYVSAKAALDNLTLGFSRYGAQYNVLVNSIRSGLIETEMSKKTEGYTRDNLERRINLIPLKRPGKPIDIARMAVYLASETGNYITGQIVTVAGGD